MIAIVAIGVALAIPASASAGSVPEGFEEKAVFSGLTQPTTVAFSPDGRVFVAEKSGLIKVFDGLNDPTPTVVADLSEEVYNYWDRGLLGMALDPQFPTRPYIYVLYARDAEPGGKVPRWGGTSLSDGCPTPPGPTADGCVITGRLSKLTVSGDSMTSEKPLITDWCQQYPSHSIGDLAFGPEGDLFVSGGEGANFITADWGQGGGHSEIPANPCGDPPGGIGGVMTPPQAEGGALRAQDVRTEADPTGLGGTVVRVDPETGEGLPDNPLAGSADPNARRIVAYGLRNPFRLTIRPGTDEVWVGDVGWGTWEEINRVQQPHDSTADNFGWPCYEGAEGGVSARMGAYEGAGLNLCKSLYNEGPSSVVAPYYSYNHASHVLPAENCTTGSSSTSGLAFYAGNSFPAKYDGALFFADYSRNCIWAMLPGVNGLPDPSKIEAFDEGAAAPVDLVEGPDGALYFPDLTDGKIWRVGYPSGNKPLVAAATATPQYGLSPLKVRFSAAGSSNPDPGATLSYAWDLDGDGQFDDSNQVSPEFTYTENGVHVAKVKVTDFEGTSDVASVSVQVGNTPPTAAITAPSAELTWAVGDQIAFSGTASDAQDGALPPSAYRWKIIMHHCPSNCHEHTIEEVENEQGGVFIAPDHEYPSWLEIELTVEDSGGLMDTKSVEVHPQTVKLKLEASPPSVPLIANDQSVASGSSVTLIKGSTGTVIAPTSQLVAGTEYVFQSWSDGGAAAHSVVVNQSQTLKATYLASPAAPSISALYPASPSKVKRPRVAGDLAAGPVSAVSVFTNATCLGSPAATGSPEEFTTAGVAVTVPPNASTDFSTRAVNRAGTSPCSNTKRYIEDSTPPETTIVHGPPAKLRVGARPRSRSLRVRAKFTIVASEQVQKFKCSFDGGHFATCVSPVIYSKLKLGPHRFEARAVDLAGNVDPTPATRSFRVVMRKSRKRASRGSRALLRGVPFNGASALTHFVAFQGR